MPYLEQGEYYSEFGNFDVRITVPKNYVVAATGELQDEDEKKWLLTRGNFTWEPMKQKIKSKGGIVKTTIQRFPLRLRTQKHFVTYRIIFMILPGLPTNALS